MSSSKKRNGSKMSSITIKAPREEAANQEYQQPGRSDSLIKRFCEPKISPDERWRFCDLLWRILWRKFLHITVEINPFVFALKKRDLVSINIDR